MVYSADWDLITPPFITSPIATTPSRYNMKRIILLEYPHPLLNQRMRCRQRYWGGGTVAIRARKRGLFAEDEGGINVCDSGVNIAHDGWFLRYGMPDHKDRWLYKLLVVESRVCFKAWTTWIGWTSGFWANRAKTALFTLFQSTLTFLPKGVLLKVKKEGGGVKVLEGISRLSTKSLRQINLGKIIYEVGIFSTC